MYKNISCELSSQDFWVADHWEWNPYSLSESDLSSWKIKQTFHWISWEVKKSNEKEWNCLYWRCFSWGHRSTLYIINWTFGLSLFYWGKSLREKRFIKRSMQNKCSLLLTLVVAFSSRHPWIQSYFRWKCKACSNCLRKRIWPRSSCWTPRSSFLLWHLRNQNEGCRNSYHCSEKVKSCILHDNFLTCSLTCLVRFRRRSFSCLKVSLDRLKGPLACGQEKWSLWSTVKLRIPYLIVCHHVLPRLLASIVPNVRIGTVGLHHETEDLLMSELTCEMQRCVASMGFHIDWGAVIASQ